MIVRAFVPVAMVVAVSGWAAAQAPRVEITSPSGAESVAGEITVTARVVADEPVVRVEFKVDGRDAGTDSVAPYEIKVDLGYENVEHRFEAIAVTVSQARGHAVLSTPRIKVDEEVTVQLQQVYVTATRGSDRLLALSRQSFLVYDDRKLQRLITFERGDVPFTAAILVDASSSMSGGKLEAALDGAQAFAQAMRPLDEAKLTVFSDRPLASTPYIGAGEAITAELTGYTATGGTAVNDRLFQALHELEERQGRRVVIMLSDGLDSHSVLTIDDIVPLIERSRALLYWLRLVSGGPNSPDLDPSREHSAWRDGKAHKRQIDLLERAVIRSGGRVAIIRGADEMKPTFAEILDELRNQYVLGYYPDSSRNDGAWHDVRVKLLVPSVDIRTSAGYLDL